MYSRGECREDGWGPTSGVVPLYWRFSVYLLSALASSRILRLSVWEKSTVGKKMASISPTETSYIISSSLMFPARSDVLAELKG